MSKFLPNLCLLSMAFNIEIVGRLQPYYMNDFRPKHADSVALLSMYIYICLILCSTQKHYYQHLYYLIDLSKKLHVWIHCCQFDASVNNLYSLKATFKPDFHLARIYRFELWTKYKISLLVSKTQNLILINFQRIYLSTRHLLVYSVVVNLQISALIDRLISSKAKDFAQKPLSSARCYGADPRFVGTCTYVCYAY